MHDRRKIHSTTPPHHFVIPYDGVETAWEIHDGELHEITADFIRSYPGPFDDELSAAPSFKAGTELEPFRTLRRAGVL